MNERDPREVDELDVVRGPEHDSDFDIDQEYEYDDDLDNEDEVDDEYDGQPDEAQEWHDFNPDC